MQRSEKFQNNQYILNFKNTIVYLYCPLAGAANNNGVKNYQKDNNL